MLSDVVRVLVAPFAASSDIALRAFVLVVCHFSYSLVLNIQLYHVTVKVKIPAAIQ